MIRTHKELVQKTMDILLAEVERSSAMAEAHLGASHGRYMLYSGKRQAYEAVLGWLRTCASTIEDTGQ